MKLKDVELPLDEIRKFCKQWQVSELAIFGSALRDDFHPDSDIDLLIAFDPSADWGLYQFSILDLRFWIDGHQPCKGSSLFIGSLTSKNKDYLITPKCSKS